ncbi:MAG: type II secretion system F family protein [Microthrixaceae bacterium]
MPAVAGVLARSLGSGMTLSEAVADAGVTLGDPLGVELRRVGSAVTRGVPIADAFDEWASESAVEEVELLSVAVRASDGHGGDLAAAFDAVCMTAADRIDAADEARALAAQATSSATTLVVLPVFGAAAFCLIDTAVARTLFLTPPGWACLTLGVAMDLSGALAMRRLVRRALR